MTIQANIKQILGVSLVSFAVLASQQALAAPSISDVYNNVTNARKQAAAAKNSLTNTVVPKLKAIESKVNEIPAKLDALPDPAYILGQSKNLIEDNVIRVTDELQRVNNDFQYFKGDNCEAGTPCNSLRQRLLGIYRGLKGIQDTLPGYDVLPVPDTLFTDPKETAILNLPPMVLYGLNTVTGPLNGLDRVEDLSQWVDQLRLYTLKPVEEDGNYRLPTAECQALEQSIVTDNAHFSNMKDLIGKVEIVTYLMAEIMPKDFTINAWVGTSIPNPALPVAVFMNKQSKDFQELIDKELEARGEQVKKCRAQEFRSDVRAVLGIN